MLAQLPLAVAVIDAASRLLYWNEPAASLFGAPPQMAADRPLLAGILAGVVALTEQQRERTLEFITTQIERPDWDQPDTCLRLSLGRDSRIILQVRGLGNHRWMLVIDDGRMAAVSSQNGPAHG